MDVNQIDREKMMGNFCWAFFKTRAKATAMYFYTAYRFEAKWFPIFNILLRVWEN